MSLSLELGTSNRFCDAPSFRHLRESKDWREVILFRPSPSLKSHLLYNKHSFQGACLNQEIFFCIKCIPPPYHKSLDWSAPKSRDLSMLPNSKVLSNSGYFLKIQPRFYMTNELRSEASHMELSGLKVAELLQWASASVIYILKHFITIKELMKTERNKLMLS